MNFEAFVHPQIRDQPVYEPGRPIDSVARDHGLSPASIAKLASNENPLGCSPRVREAIRDVLEELHRYPDGGATFLREALADRHGLSPDQFLPGNGSNEVLELVARACLGPGTEAVMGAQAFIVYKLVTRLVGAKPVEIPMPGYTHDLDAMAAAVNERTRVVFLPSPNNPTGTANDPDAILAFARSLPDHVLFVFDEAYAEYLDEPPDLRPLIAEGRPVLCTRTFSKIHGLAALRIGYGYADAGLIGLLNRVREPFNLGSLGQAAARAAIRDADWIARCREANRAGLAALSRGLSELGLEVVPSMANFVLVRVPDPPGLFRDLQTRGLIVRPVAGYGLPEHLRISVGTPAQNKRLLTTLGDLLARTPTR
ncbi:MAG: histidinol-phosphate transaminase [Opitutales bacterium]